MHIQILGTRGIPATHGGFETFAEDLSLFLAERNYEVTVYCQLQPGQTPGEDTWKGVRRVRIPTIPGPMGTILFDIKATLQSMFRPGVVLTLGYNTGVFSFLYRLRRTANLMNMDGLEWKRKKWSRLQRAWLWFNEIAGARAATHLIADHPEIKKHLLRHTPSCKITMIPYGAEPVCSAPADLVQRFGLAPKGYYLMIARPEPENSVLEIISSFSCAKARPLLVVLGSYDRSRNEYHRRALDAAGPNVVFLGSIYDQRTVAALRFHSKAYIHGHTVGGTNPSLVESLAAGNAVVAHDNIFNRWVGGPHARYFNDSTELIAILDSLESDGSSLAFMEAASRERHAESFQQQKVMSAYEKILLEWINQQPTERSDAVSIMEVPSRSES